MSNIESPNYPIGAFPTKLQLVILEQYNNNEAALPTIGCSIIGALSAAIQDKGDVEVRPGTVKPYSINTLVIAGSGARKTTVDAMMMKAASCFEENAFLTLKPQHAKQKAQRLVWTADVERLEKQLCKGVADKDQLKLIQHKLGELYLNEPTQVPTPNILYRDATPEAIAKGLDAWPSAWLTTSEAGPLLSGRTMSNLGLFNSLWDGDALTVDRASSESYVVERPRLTISLMVQEKAFARFLANQGSLARDIGFLARFLVCFPTPLEGTRFGLNATGSWPHHEAFQARLLEILMSTLPVDGVMPTREVLTLSDEARAALKDFTDQVERQLAPGQALHDVSDCASKIGENAVRLGALFHYYEGCKGPITSDTLLRAIEICKWHLLEFIRLFRESPELPPEIQDAMAVEKFLSDRLLTFPRANMVPKRYLLTYGPNSIRKKVRLDLALQVLSSEGKITVHRERKMYWVHLNPVFFPAVIPYAYQVNYHQHLSPVLPQGSSPVLPRGSSPGLGFI